MPKSRVIEDTLAALNRLRDDPSSTAGLGELRRALAGKSPHVAAKAAQIAGEAEIAALTADLVAAFDRFLVNPLKSDPNCAAKTAIAEALYRIGADTADVFLRGIRHVQMEPVWGGKTDTAGTLRGVCALGLVRIRYDDALVEIADLLADPDDRVRAAAARAIAYSDSPQGIPLLRLRALAGDVPEVVSECFAALLALDAASGMPFVARFLNRDDQPLQEAAALALGGARLAAAFPLLREWWERTPQVDLRRTALLAIAMLKQDAALEFLLTIVRQGRAPDGRDAIAALAIYRHDEALAARLREAAEGREDVDLRAAVKQAFEP
jgi:HEAT repeat protein